MLDEMKLPHRTSQETIDATAEHSKWTNLVGKAFLDCRFFPLIGISLLLAWYTGNFFIGERIPVNQGLGWDGTIYGGLAQDFFGYLNRNGIDNYRASRVFPSFVIHGISGLLGIKLDKPDRVFEAFYIWNTFLLALSAYIWSLIVRNQNWSARMFWFGFAGLFFNFANLKLYPYCPVSTDAAAFFFGIFFLYLVLKRQFIITCFTAIPAFFTWPTVVYLLPVLIMFSVPPVPTRFLSLRNYSLLAGLFLATVVVLLQAYLTLAHPYQLAHGAAQVSRELLTISFFFSACYVFWVARESDFLAWRPTGNADTARTAIILACAVIPYYVLLTWIRSYFGSPSAMGMERLFSGTLVTAVTKPLIFLIAHVAYFGPIVILLLLFLKDVCQQSTSRSYGLFLFLLATMAMALNSESRMLILNYPFIVFGVCSALGDVHLSWRALLMFCGTSWLVSKVYVPLNLHPLQGNLLDFPYQFLFMNIGPWMGWTGYCINAAIFLLALIAMLLFHRMIVEEGTYRT